MDMGLDTSAIIIDKITDNHERRCDKRLHLISSCSDTIITRIKHHLGQEGLFCDSMSDEMCDTMRELCSSIVSRICRKVEHRMDKWRQSSLGISDHGYLTQERFTSSQSKCLQKCRRHEKKIIL